MRILHVVHNYYPSVGGTQLLFQNISEKLVATYNDEVTVYTTDSYYGPQRKEYKKINEKCSFINGVKIIRFGYYRFHHKWIDKLVQLCFRFNIKVPEKLRQFRTGPLSAALNTALLNNTFDVVCASASDYSFMLYPLFRHRGAQPKPFVFMGALHLAESASKDNLLRQTLLSIKSSEYYIANTIFEKKRLVEYGVKRDIIKVIGCGINMPDYEHAQSSAVKEQLGIKDDIVIGYFGRMDKVKGIETILKAFDILAKNNSNISLIIAGAASGYTKEIRLLIASFDTQTRDKCFVLENVPAQQKAAVITAFDIFSCPSEKESFGIVFLEAWACKKPVIGTNTGAVRSVISHGENGYLIQPGNVNELVDYCTVLINDKQLRIAMGECGYNKTAQYYTWDIITCKYRKVYQAAMAKFNSMYSTNQPLKSVL